MSNLESIETSESCDIAIIGMAGRFPKAADIDQYWRLLKEGVECISYFSDDEIETEMAPEDLANPNFVKAKAVLDDVEWFDAAFFNIPAREAEIMDPQHRLFLECLWTALENAGCDPERFDGNIAVYAGSSLNTYMLSRLPYLASLGRPLDAFQLAIAGDKDHLATRASYKLNLRGESLTVQTACSTSLVAIHLACQSLLSGQCDIALAGGVSIQVPQRTGYLYQEGMVSSPDGRCRTFDHKAKGTVAGNGLGVVVLKMLSDAVRDGDYIHAVIKGSAINNDGRAKMGYTAPSIDGQANVIAKALAMAGVEADSIGYVEAHGTGTPVGDPIEVEALTRAYRRHTTRKGFCALGAVKSSIGHLDAAAGVAGLIKTALVVKNGWIPPVLHFEKANPAIDFDESPFYVADRLREWKPESGIRRAGVSSFGIGGTNAHMIIEQAPPRSASSPSRPEQLLTLSAQTTIALTERAKLLAEHLEANPDLDLADVAFTQNTGRAQFDHRSFILAGNSAEAVARLRAETPGSMISANKNARILFLFPGQGAQSIGMARSLYDSEKGFRDRLDQCASILKKSEGVDLLSLIYPDASAISIEDATKRLARPENTLPALFAVEYALAEMWMSWGVQPSAMIGHSFGEYVAACLAGVFSLEDGLKLAVARGRLMQQLAPGGMLDVALTETELKSMIGERLAIASVNAEERTVLSGPIEEIERVETALTARKIGYRRLEVPYAYHSPMVEAIIAPLVELIGGFRLSEPAIPYISSLTGDWIEAAQATNPVYWAEQMRRTVRFAAGVERAVDGATAVLLEAGPGRTLTALAKRKLRRNRGAQVLSSLNPSGSEPGRESVLETLGQLWLAGAAVDWRSFYRGEQRQKTPLPAYPFDRKRYWIDVKGASFVVSRNADAHAETTATDLADPVAGTASGHAVERSPAGQVFVAPRNEIEEKLVRVWTEVLGLEGIGVLDNFYNLGGDSLLATQVYSRVKQELAADLTLQQALSRQTVAEWAEMIGARANESPASPTILPAPRSERPPLSFAQQRLWFIDQSAPGGSVFNLGYAVRLDGDLDPAVFKRCLDEIVKRQESLRTTFPIVDGRPIQAVADIAEFALTTLDLAGIGDADVEMRVAEMARDEARRPFDLSRGPLTRATLVKLGARRHVVLFTMHHIITDGWSFGVLIRELAALYRAFLRGESSPLPPPPIQYTDYADWQRRQLQGEPGAAQLAFWKRQLGGALPTLRLPFDRPRPKVRSFEGRTLPFTVGPALTRDLKSLAQLEGVSLFTLLLAGFQTLLHRYSRQDDIIVGCPVAGRTAVETEGLIGLFLNTLALRADCSRNPPFREFLGRVRRTTLDAFSNQDLPFDQLIEAIQPVRSLSYTPIYQVFFNFQNTPAAALDLEGLSITRLEFDNGASSFDLILNMTEAGDQLNGAFQYSAELFETSTIATMAGRWEQLLAGVVAGPETRLGSLEILSPAESFERGQTDDEGDRSDLFNLRATKRKTIPLIAAAQQEREHV